MSALLKQYIEAVLAEVVDYRVPNQLVSKRSPKKQTDKKVDANKDSEEEKEEMDEMNVVANIAGYTAPLGASSADVGLSPAKPGQKLKKTKKNYVRWK
jgi:hypothetical protein